jgi:hypothetical protein
LGAGDAFMVREEDGGEAQLAAPAGHFEGGHPAVKGSRAVQVQVDSNRGNFPQERAPSAAGHVRYYRRGEGSGKGLTPVRGGY